MLLGENAINFQMSTTVPSPARTRACCENGRPIMRDPHTGQTICSCQYGTALLNYSRTQGLPEEIYGTSTAAYVAGAKPGYIQLPTEGSAFYSPLVSTCPQTFTTVWPNSADDKLITCFFLFSLQKTGFDILCTLSPDTLHVMSKPVFWE